MVRRLWERFIPSMDNSIGEKIHALARRLWGINRSITGDGVRETLSVLKQVVPRLTMHEVPSGTAVFDWTVPPEWRVRDAYILTPGGKKICHFKSNNLHLVGYSVPVSRRLCLSELQEHLHSLPDKPEAIPYVTSYYKRRWGFCIAQNERDLLEDGEYEVFIDSELFDGSLAYGELVIPGRSSDEVFISTYICHPSMANNELSGPTVVAYLAKWLAERADNRYTYRFVFIPETIGSITYLKFMREHLVRNVIAGFNVTCIGDDRDYSYLPSRRGDTLSDTVARHVLSHTCETYKSYKWTHRGSDERQYCAPGVDLPIATIARSLYGNYYEYHTSLDDLINVVTPSGLEGGYKVLKRSIEAIEENYFPVMQVVCEPQLGKRGLYPNLSTESTWKQVRVMMDLISWSDGTKSLVEIADLIEVPVWSLYPVARDLVESGLLILSEGPVLHFPGGRSSSGADLQEMG